MPRWYFKSGALAPEAAEGFKRPERNFANGGAVTINADTIHRVWEKGSTVLGVDSDAWRKDECTAWIGRNNYGEADRELGFGWEIDHIKPVSEGGGDDLSNLRPFQWRNSRAKRAGRSPCVVVSSGNKNVFAR